jgi:ATP-dependent RNA helicase DeaD
MNCMPNRTRRRKTTPAETPTAAEAAPPPPSGAAVAEPPDFAALGLSRPLLQALGKVGFTTPTDIQRELIPHALAGRDCLGQARTGTGKTAAFALPMLDRLTPGTPVQALVLVPTRELASQVDSHIRQFSGSHKLNTVLLYGGRRLKGQMDALARGPEVVIGTPGRVLDLMHRKALSLDGVRIAVLDEVDRMLDIGFRDDIRRILRRIEHAHQTIFVSATLDDEIRRLAKAFMTEPVEVNVSGDSLTVENIEHGFVPVLREDKFASLLGFLKTEVPKLAIVFTNTKHNARRIAARLKKEGVSCQEIHGDLDQARRERVMKSFRNASIQVLVATDLASRGLDVMEVSHIVNYDIPADASVYVHRIGRTARMGKHGYAVTFVTPEEGELLTTIELLINQMLPQFDAPWLIRSTPPPAVAPAATAPAAAEAEKAAADTRYQAPLQRDEMLEAVGLRPLRRTLGSRFRSSRRSRR